MDPIYPAMLKLESTPCLVVGGGGVARRKISSLIAAKAKVTVVAPRFVPQVAEWIRAGVISGHEREYERSDGEGMRLVFAATDSKEINLRVWRDARRRGQWINVADAPELCDFYVPATVERGRLKIAVSTSGASPALAADIARALSGQFGEEYGHMLDFLYQLRRHILETVKEEDKRKRMLQAMARTDWLRAMRSASFDPSPHEWAARLKRESLSEVPSPSVEEREQT